jgi:signal transduction histidine kinase
MKSGFRSGLTEPGVLPVFRMFVAFEIALLLTRAILDANGAELPPAPSPWPALAALFIFLGYLSWPALHARLGRAYLPVALAFAAAGPLLGSAAAMRLRVQAGASAAQLAEGTWLLVPLLLVPVILVAWQYGFRRALGFCVLTGAADVLLKLPPSGDAATVSAVVGVAAARCLIFLPVAYAVAHLVDEQRRQREALAEANARLARHSQTLEHLATSEERNRIAREMHDTLAHGLSGVAVQLEAMNALWDTQPKTTRALLGGALDTTRTALGEARRAIADLRASPLEEFGLARAIQELAETEAQRADLALELRVPDALEGLPAAVEQALYRITAEALANVARHASASRVRVLLEESPARVRLTVADDGRGFDPGGAQEENRFGVFGMRERAHAIGSHLNIESAPGRGVNLWIDVAKPA